MGDPNLRDMIYWIFNKLKSGNFGNSGGGGITQTQLDNALGNKVDKVPGKVLSSNDYTNDDKSKVGDITNKLEKGTYTGTAKDLADSIEEIKNNSRNISWADIQNKPSLDSLPSYKTITDAHKFLDKDGAIHFGSGSGIANAPGSYFYEMVGFTHSSKGWGFIIAKNLDINDRKLYVKQVISSTYTDWFELNGNSENISIRNYIECNHGNNGSIIFVETSLTIQLKDLISLDSVSFRKVFPGGNVTFTCDGKQIIYTSGNLFNGGDGSTATVSIWNNKCYIDIRNI